MNCSQVRIRLAGYIDGELGTVESLDLGMHVRACEQCRGARAAQAFVHLEVRREARRFLAPARLHDRIRKKLGM